MGIQKLKLKMKFFSALSCLVILSVLYTAQACNQAICKKISKNGRCGPQHGNTICGGGTCSRWAWCGSGKDAKGASYAGTRTWGTKYDYKAAYACCKCNGNLCKKVSKNGRCGPSQGKTICKYGTCSKWGWCGSGKDSKGASYAGKRPFGTKYDSTKGTRCC